MGIFISKLTVELFISCLFQLNSRNKLIFVQPIIKLIRHLVSNYLKISYIRNIKKKRSIEMEKYLLEKQMTLQEKEESQRSTLRVCDSQWLFENWILLIKKPAEDYELFYPLYLIELSGNQFVVRARFRCPWNGLNYIRHWVV